jgi:uncharacterized coiled-coil protein SlyX
MEKTLLQKAKVLEELNHRLAEKYESRALLARQVDALEYRLHRLEEEMLQLSRSIVDLETCHNLAHDLNLSSEPPSTEQENVQSQNSEVPT